VPAARKTPTARGDNVTVTASDARVFVDAVAGGALGITNPAEQYVIHACGADADDLYAIANKLGIGM
jgi:hypothetical protein